MDKIGREKWVVSRMIALYCRRCEGNARLCDSCRELEAYAHRRLDGCRYGADKPSCKRCPTHCYAPKWREQIRIVMRYAGPRMILYYPLAALRHIAGELFAPRR